MNFTFRNARLLASVAALCLVVLLTLTVNADVINKNFNATDAVTLGDNDILVINGTAADNNFSYQNYSGTGLVYFKPVNYSYFTASIPSGYTNTKVFIAGNALGLKDSKTSSDVYGSGRILVLTNELPTTTGTTTVNEGTLFNANGSSPTYDNDIQIKGVGGLRVGWNLTLTVSGKISDYKDANGNVTPGKLIIEKDGTDIRITNWNNDYSGGTQIGGGKVTSGSNSTTLTIQPRPEGSTGTTPLGTGPIYFGSDNSKLDMGGYTLSISGVDNQKESGGNYAGNTIVNDANSMASPTFNVAEGVNLVYTGTLPTISGTLTKNGAGSQTIVTANVDALNITGGTMGFSGALTTDSVTIASGATLKMTGTGSSLTVANPIEIPNDATLYFENAVPRTTADLTINIAEGGALTFYETNTEGHNINNGLINSKTYNVSITGDGNLIKTGSGNLYMFSSANYNPALSIVLSDKAVIDVQDGFFINGGNYPDCWKATSTVGETTVTTYNQATLNVGPNGSVNLWDGTLYVGGITGGSLEGDKHGLIMSTNNGHLVVGMDMTDADKSFVYNGDVTLNASRSITKEGKTTQTFAGTFSNLGTTTVNEGTLELSGTATLVTVNVNKDTDAQTEGTLKISGGTTEVTGALKAAGNIILSSGATLKMSGTGSSLTAANPIEIPNNATLYFENAVPRTTADLTINIAEGGALTFYETNTDGHNINNGLINSKTYNVSITGDGNLIKTGSGNLYMFSSANYNPALSIVLSDKAVIDVQDGFFINGGNYPDCWKATSTVGETTVTTYNQATLNVGPNGSVNLWDGTLYVGGITGGSLEGDKHGEINSPSYNGKIIVGAGITDADKRFVFNGNVDLNSGRTFTKEGAATQVVAGTFNSLGTTNINGGTLELAGTATVTTANINNASLDISGTATLGTINFSNNGEINVIQNGAATLTKALNFSKTTPITVASTATLILDPGDEQINAQTYTDSFVVPGTVVVKSGYFRTVDVSSPTKLQLDGGTLQNNGNGTGTSTSNINTDIHLTSDSRLMAGWSGILNVNNTISGPGKLIIRDDSGVVYLYKSNTYTGGTQVGDSYKTNPAARLVAGAANVLGTGRLYFGKAGASFDMAGNAQTIGGLGKDMNKADEVQYNGSVNNSGAETTLTIDVPEGETYNFNGSVANNVNIVKNGEGTQQFNIVNLANAELFSDSIVVNAGRLDMKEFFVGTLEVESDGVFSPGNSVGTLNLTGDFNLNGGTLLMEIDETGSDELIINGDLNLNGGNIVLDFVNGMAPNAEFAVVLDASNSADLDVLSLIDPYYYSNLSYGVNGSGRWVLSGKIDANAVPEPSTWALLILGAAGLLYWRKRR